MAGKTGTSRSATEERIEKAEEWLCAGIAPGRVERKLAEEYGISVRQARRYKEQVYARWGEQSQGDAPHRREKLIRMMERLYAKALSDGDLSVAQRCAAQLLKASGAFTQRSATRDAALERLGPPPADSANALPYAQQILLIELHEVVTNVHLDPRERLRWESELTAKLGMVYRRITGEGGDPIQVAAAPLHLTGLTDEQLSQLRAIHTAIQQRQQQRAGALELSARSTDGAAGDAADGRMVAGGGGPSERES